MTLLCTCASRAVDRRTVSALVAGYLHLRLTSKYFIYCVGSGKLPDRTSSVSELRFRCLVGHSERKYAYLRTSLTVIRVESKFSLEKLRYMD